MKPIFEHAATRTTAELEELLSLELELDLRPTADWVTTPASMVLLSAKERGGQAFAVRLDPSKLSPGASSGQHDKSTTTPTCSECYHLPGRQASPLPWSPAPSLAY